MIRTWRPSEIIINNKVKDDPITLHFIEMCPDASISYVDDSKPTTVKEESDILDECSSAMLPQIRAGKNIVHISPPGVDMCEKFVMDDSRMMCPEFDKLVFASNGCYYNCDWCFLKLTYRANQNYINVHVQYEDIKKRIANYLKSAKEIAFFNCGELADSLALEHLTKFGQEFIPWFGQQDKAFLYMLTKSTNIDEILDLKHNKRTVIAWSINAPIVSELFEIGAPRTAERLAAAKKVQNAGYPLRIRLDPIIPIKNWKHFYAGTIKKIFQEVKPERITLGTLRLEEQLYNMRKIIFARTELIDLAERLKPMLPDMVIGHKKNKKGKTIEVHSVGKYSFPEEERIEIFKFAVDEIRKHSPDITIALCKETANVWKEVGLDLKECKCVCIHNSKDMTNRTEAKVSKPIEVTLKADDSDSTIYEIGKLYTLKLDELNPDPNQPRKIFDDADLKELADSIVRHGVLQPVLFRKGSDGRLMLVAGERRYQASKIAEKTEIPAMYIDGTDAAEIALVENLLRVDITPIEEAEALKRLQDEKNYSNVQLANVIGKAESTVSEILKLNMLPKKLRDKHRNDRNLSRRKWLEIAKTSDPKEIKKLYTKLLKNASRDELRTGRTPRERDIDSVFKTMIGSITTRLNATTLDDIEVGKRQVIVDELNALKTLIEEKLRN